MAEERGGFPDSMFNRDRNDRVLAEKVAAHDVEIRVNAERAKEDRSVLTSMNQNLTTLVTQVGSLLEEIKRGEQTFLLYGARIAELEDWRKGQNATHKITHVIGARLWSLFVAMAAGAVGYVAAVVRAAHGS
jgi:hypothetical protein